MQQYNISQVARQFGLRASAVRYYEKIGVLPQANRVRGRRRYGMGDLRRLAVIQRARQIGFSLDEIRELFSGFRPGTPAWDRWQQLSQRKLTELEASLERIMTMKTLLERMSKCQCDALDECGAALLRHTCEPATPDTPPVRRTPARRE